MKRRIGISGGSATWRRGMMAILGEAGFDTVEVADLSRYRPGRDGAAVVIRIDSPEMVDALASVHEEYPAIPLIAVVPDLDLGSFASTVCAGATVAMDDEAEVDSYGVVVEAALRDRASVPRELMAALAARVPQIPDPSAWVTDTEASWLVALAAGTTVADLANREGYSEREMFRTLNDTYARIGVNNRTEAIIWATRHGLLDEN